VKLVVPLLPVRDALLASVGRLAHAHHRGEQRPIQLVMDPMVPEDIGLDLRDGGAEPAEARRQLLQRLADLVVDGQPRDRGQHRHAEVGEPVPAGGRQLDPPGYILSRFGAREDGQRQLQVLGAAGDRTLPPP
jgi:hypothetical protein